MVCATLAVSAFSRRFLLFARLHNSTSSRDRTALLCLCANREDIRMMDMIWEVFAVFGGISALVVMGANVGPEKYKMREAMYPLLSAGAVFTFGAGTLYVLAQLVA